MFRNGDIVVFIGNSDFILSDYFTINKMYILDIFSAFGDTKYVVTDDNDIRRDIDIDWFVSVDDYMIIIRNQVINEILE